MRWHRPKVFHEPDCFLRASTSTACRMAACVALVAAALMVDCCCATESGVGAPTHARRARPPAVPSVGAAAAFIAPAIAPAALWASSRREGEHLRSVGGFGAPAGCGRERGRRCATAVSRSGLMWALRTEHAEEERIGRQRNLARLLRLREHDSRRSSSSSPSPLLLRAGAAGLDVNATAVGADAGSSSSRAPAAASAAAIAADAPVGVPDGAKKGQPKRKKKQQQASSIKESTSIEGKEATVIITEAGGRPHTVASKAKISAANKGKKPWNVGVGHSEETRRKIAEGARNAARRRKIKTAESLGMTLEEYEEMKARKPVGKRNPEVTEETRKKISTRLKAKWRDPAYRERRKLCMPNRLGVPHTEETKARISAAVKEKWNDPVYREKITNMVRTEETRAKIGKVIREQWADPAIREERLKNMTPRTEAHNKRIGESVRSKWSDPEYRKRTSEAMRKAAYDRIIASGGVPKPPRVRRPRAPRAPGDPRGRGGSRLEGVGISREAQRNLNRWAKERKQAEVRFMRQTKKDQKAAEAAKKLEIKRLKEEAERLATEEEAALTAGLDDLEKVLMRSTIRAKKQERMAKVAEAVAQAKADAAPKEQEQPQEPEEPVQAVPDGFEMLEINGRMVLRMK